MILNGFTSPSSCSRSSSGSYWDLKSWSVGGVPFMHLSAASTPLLSGDQGGLSHALPSLPRHRRSNLVIGTVSWWMPLAIYWGKFGMHFWTAVAFAYLFTVLECIRCALAGMYADIPFVCDAAYIQIPYD
ncbi:hypothetical protein CRYUN_Cryun27aG0099700 [Craigia yunnanensis]